MKIRPKNILLFQNGGVPQWYLDRYGNRTKLLGWDLDQRYNYADNNLMSNDHRNAGNLDTVYRKNIAYTGTPGAISADIQSFYNSDGKGMSAEDFVNFYNKNAAEIRSHWALDQTYNKSTAGKHNRLFRRMFLSRSNMSQSPGSDYNIGYLLGLTKGGYDILDIEGSSTWLRRMDLYEHEFDPNNPDTNRLHELILSDGTKAIVYKKANGDIGLLRRNNDPNNPENPENPNDPERDSIVGRTKKYGIDWNNFTQKLLKIAPDLLGAGRLALTLNANKRIYDAALKGVSPNLQQTYNTYRQVVGDEGTKQAYYRRAAQGQTRAAQPFTSDADRQIAYQNEAKRIGDELRAQGDLADNAEIRRTSDESNQHQWANIQRATGVANYNIEQLNAANAAKQNILALKYAANKTSWDNYLSGIEYDMKQKQAKNEAIRDQINALEEKIMLDNDEEYQFLYKDVNDAWNDALRRNNNDALLAKNDPTYIEKKKLFNSKLYQMLIDRLNRMLNRDSYFFAKNGMKFSYTRKDDLLYKTARDAVEHFRKMTALQDNSFQRSRRKPVTLTPHPKGSTKKYLLGGVAPFTVYTPVTVGGSNTISSQVGDTGNTGSKAGTSKEQDPLKLILDLIKDVSGLPSDVNGIFKGISNFLVQMQEFGSTMSPEDISAMYVRYVEQINNIKHSKESYTAAKKHAEDNLSMDEFAIVSGGRFVVQNRDTGELSVKSWDEILKENENVNILKNLDLLRLREYDSNYMLRKGDELLLPIVNRSVGLSKITEYIKAHQPNFKDTESIIEGYTKKLSDLIKKGFELLLEAPDGSYEFLKKTKDLQIQIQAALSYIMTQLPNNMRDVLQAHADMQGTSIKDIIMNKLIAESSPLDSLTFDAVTGKAAKDASGSSKSSSGTDTPSSVQFLLGNGYLEMVEFNIGNSQSVRALGRFGILQDSTKKNLGQGSTLLDVSGSLFGGILDLDRATFGGSRLNQSAYSHIILNNSDCVGVDLPVKKDINGNYVPDFLLLKLIEKVEETIKNNNITNPILINKIYKDSGLPEKFDSNGNLLQQNYRRFAAIKVTLDQKALKNGSPINMNEVQEADENERELFIEIMKKSGIEDYDLSNGWLWSDWGKDRLYKGTIFAPVRDNIVGGYISGGLPLDSDIPNDANLVEIMQNAPKISLYKQAPALSSLR